MATKEPEPQTRQAPKCPACRTEEAKQTLLFTGQGDEIVFLECDTCTKKAQKYDRIYFFLFTSTLILYCILVYKFMELVIIKIFHPIWLS